MWPKQKKTADGATGALPASAPTTPVMKLSGLCGSVHTPSPHTARVLSCSLVSNSVTPWTIASQALPPMGLSKQEYWKGLSFPSPGDLSDPGVKLESPTN